MDKKEYFLRSLHDKAHYAREWVLRAFSIVLDEPKEEQWALRHTKTQVEVFVDGKWEVLEGTTPYDPPFVYHDSTGPLKKGDVINLDRDLLNSTWGDILVNSRVLGYATGSAIPFMEGPFGPADIEAIFIKRMVDEPATEAEFVEGEIYPYHWLRCGKAIGDLDGFEFFIPSVTEHCLQPYPGLEEDRAKLISQYSKDEIRDPVNQAKIQGELVNKFKEYLKGDPSEGFIFKDKTISTSIKQMFLVHGPEAGFSEGGLAEFVPTSLNEGINTEYYKDMMNSLRAAAFFRGAMTALAGTDVDLFGRIFQGVQVVDGFCGTKNTTKPIRINKRYMGRWTLENGERVQITQDNYGKYDDKKVPLFDPAYCKASGNDVCSVCIGAAMAKYPTSLGSAASGIQSMLMSIMMASAHAKQLKTVPLKQDWLE